MKLEIHRYTQDRLPLKRIKQLFHLIVAEEARPDWEGRVNLVFVSDRRMQALNKQYRQMNRPTDVLSFNIDHPLTDDSTFGEIYISTHTARRQAKGYGGNLNDEYLRLFCHGLLHLFGYDHIKPSDEQRMKVREAHFLMQVVDEVPL